MFFVNEKMLPPVYFLNLDEYYIKNIVLAITDNF